MTESVADLVTRVVTEAADPSRDWTPADAVLAVPAQRLSALFHAQLSHTADATLLTTGTGASPGVAFTIPVL
jgi:hypothetical protein